MSEMKHGILINGHGEFNSSLDLDLGPSHLGIVSVLPTFRAGKSTLLNDLFSTSFTVKHGFKKGRKEDPRKTAGLWVELAGRDLVVFDSEKRGSSTTKKVVTLQACLSDVVVFVVFESDLGRRDSFDIEVIQSFFVDAYKISHPEGLKSKLIILVRDVHDAGTKKSQKNTERLILRKLEKLWMSCRQDRKANLRSFLDIVVWNLPHHRLKLVEYNESLKNLHQLVLDAVEGGKFSKSIDGFSFTTYSQFVWTSIREDETEMLPKLADLVAINDSDVQFERIRRESWRTIEAWRLRVDSSSIIFNFGSSASDLYTKALRECVRYAISSDLRSTFSQALARSSVSWLGLFVDQLKLLQRAANSEVRTKLLEEVRRSGTISETRQDSITREAISRFCSGAETLEVSDLRLSAYAARIELENALHSLITGFSGSAVAQATAASRNAQLSRSNRRTYIPGNILPGVSLGVNVNSEVRNNGYGNLQMWSSYSNGPHTLNLGYANDADAVLQQGDGVVPFIRLQPSLRFDIDAPYMYSELQKRRHGERG